MRTVRDNSGTTWICLELPEIPAERQVEAAGAEPDLVAIECNSGAARVIALVRPGWDDDFTDDELTDAIVRFGR